jgi:hypothetical protein
MRADADLMVYVAARWPSLVRDAVLLGVHPDEAADAATDALARCRGDWARASREENVDALVHRELVRAAGRRSRTPEATREQAARELLVLAPPDLDDLGRRERDHRRTVLRRAGIVAVPLLLVAVGAGVYVATYGGYGDDSIGSVPVTREENPAPGFVWYAGGRLHLDHVVLDIDDDLHDMTRIGDGVVYGDDDGRVVYAADDGSRTVLGHKDPDAPVVATDENGWAAWIDTGSDGPTVVVKEAQSGNEVGRFRVRDGARVVAVDGISVYFMDAGGAHQRFPQATMLPQYTDQFDMNTIDLGRAELLDVRSRIDAFQVDPGTIQVVQSVFNQALDLPGRGAVLSPDGTIVATRLMGTVDRLTIYDARSGSEVPSGLTADDHVLAVAPGDRLTIAYIVDPGGSDSELELRTCDLDRASCQVAARIPDDSGTPLLAR